MHGVALRKIRLPDFGSPEELPVISRSEYEYRLAETKKRMKRCGIDVLVVYGDREHSANLCFLTGYDPRFEEALFLLSRTGSALLLVGNEGLGYVPHSPLPLDVELYQDFSLPGQPRDHSRPLATILRSFGLRQTSRVGCIGWKTYGSSGIELPYYIVEELRRLAGCVFSANDLLTHPARGLRLFCSPAQIALMEYAATRTSLGVHRALCRLQPGVREYELEREFQPDGLPLSCHSMVNFGEKARTGLASPSDRKAGLGESFTLAFGTWGALTCRAGAIASCADELPVSLREFYPQFAANYFATVASWYEAVRVGTTARKVMRAVEATQDKRLFRLALNPGHSIGLDEWIHSPFCAGSSVRLKSGMALQADLIPVSTGPFCVANMEDGIVLADDKLRAQLRRQWPECWQRICRRRKFVREKLGIALHPSVLPLSNTPAFFAPYALAHELVFVRRTRSFSH